MNKFYRWVLAFALCVVSGCSHAPVKTYPSEELISAQEATLKKLHYGQDKAEALSLLPYTAISFFDVKEGGKYFSYLALTNLDTHVSFGLLFEDDKLQRLIVDGEVQDFFACRSMAKTHGEHWLSFGIAPYLEWLKDHDRLAGGFDYRLAHPPLDSVKQSKLAAGIEVASTAIVYTPFFIVASPFIARDYLSGKYQKRVQERKLQKELLEERWGRIGAVLPGTSEAQMIADLGPANYIIEVDGANVYVYHNFSYSFAIKEGVIVWREHRTLFESRAQQTQSGNEKNPYADVNCGKLADFWQGKK